MKCKRSWEEEVQSSSLLLINQRANGLSDTNVDADHVYMLFSATFPKQARTVAKEYMSSDHIRIRVGRAGSSHVNVTQKVNTSCQVKAPTNADF